MDVTTLKRTADRYVIQQCDQTKLLQLRPCGSVVLCLRNGAGATAPLCATANSGTNGRLELVNLPVAVLSQPGHACGHCRTSDSDSIWNAPCVYSWRTCYAPVTTSWEARVDLWAFLDWNLPNCGWFHYSSSWSTTLIVARTRVASFLWLWLCPSMD